MTEVSVSNTLTNIRKWFTGRLYTNDIWCYNAYKVFPRNTRLSRRIFFRTDSKEGALYKRSPHFVGAKLWDSLTLDSIELPDIYTFKARFKRLDSVCIDRLKKV